MGNLPILVHLGGINVISSVYRMIKLNELDLLDWRLNTTLMGTGRCSFCSSAFKQRGGIVP